MAALLKKQLFFSFFLPFFVFSQNQEFITGRLIDAKNLEPVSFASIRIKNKGLGVISNIDGSFKIPLRYKELGDIIEISSMGYQSEEILIYDFLVHELNIVKIKPAIIELKEVLVTAKGKRNKKPTAKEIVQRAIDQIAENYPVSPYSQIGYYRDYQLNNEEYVNLNEAIIEVHDQGFKAVDSSTSKVVLYNYKENLNFQRDTLSRKPYSYDYNGLTKIIEKGHLASYGGNEFTILNVHNAIRNYKINSYSFIYRLETDMLNEHIFSLEDDSFVDDDTLYSVKFIKNHRSFTAYGKMYISKKNYAIYKLEYVLYDNTKNNLKGFKDKNEKKKEVIFETKTAYRKKKNKMYLNYISFNNNFTLRNPPAFGLKHVGFKFNRKPVAVVDKKGISYDSLYKKERTIVLSFTNTIDEETASNLKNYKVKFNNEQLKLDSLMVEGDKVVLYPRSKRAIQELMLNEMEALAKKNALNEENAEVVVRNLKDIDGNMINRWTSKDYNQFREFFVQQVKLKPTIINDSLLMNKDKPIFNNQPMVKPDDYDDYWMNTPLQKH